MTEDIYTTTVPKKQTKYTNEELINSLINFYKSTNRIPTLKDHGYIDVSYFINAFGCWSNAKTMAGFNGSTYHRKNNNYHINKGHYQGIWCDSTWELAFLIFCLDHGYNIKRYNGYFPYNKEGKTKKYFPDFLLNDKDIIEIKGLEDKNFSYKKSVIEKNDIHVLYRKEITPYINYVKNEYNVKDIRYLYDYDTKRFKICKHCQQEFINVDKKVKYCCQECYQLYRREHPTEFNYTKTEEHRKKLSIATKNQYRKSSNLNSENIKKKIGQSHSTLTDEQALEVYNLAINGEHSQKEITEKYNISKDIISRIKLKKTYKWIHEKNQQD